MLNAKTYNKDKDEEMMHMHDDHQEENEGEEKFLFMPIWVLTPWGTHVRPSTQPHMIGVDKLYSFLQCNFEVRGKSVCYAIYRNISI